MPTDPARAALLPPDDGQKPAPDFVRVTQVWVLRADGSIQRRELHCGAWSDVQEMPDDR